MVNLMKKFDLHKVPIKKFPRLLFVSIISFIIGICVLLAAGYNILMSHLDMEYDMKIQDNVVKCADENQPLNLKIDFASLGKRNPDIIGWVYLPGTIINYPVVQTNENETYLHERFDGDASDYGTIFADYRCDSHDGNNLILYGHNQSQFNPVKFSILYNYLTDEEFIKEHPYFEYYDAATGKGRIYKIFSVVRADITTQENIKSYYRNVPDEAYADYLSWLQSQSLVLSDVAVDPTKKSLLLSTCTDDADWQRVLVCCQEN